MASASFLCSLSFFFLCFLCFFFFFFSFLLLLWLSMLQEGIQKGPQLLGDRNQPAESD